MERAIVRQQFLLSVPSEEATTDDLGVARDLEDTLMAHRDTCAGMAANMIFERKRIISFFDERGRVQTMLNPKISTMREPFETSEGCLCLEGTRPVRRYRRIRVTWQDTDLNSHTAYFRGFVAEVIQHECDHLEGIVI